MTISLNVVDKRTATASATPRRDATRAAARRIRIKIIGANEMGTLDGG